MSVAVALLFPAAFFLLADVATPVFASVPGGIGTGVLAAALVACFPVPLALGTWLGRLHRGAPTSQLVIEASLMVVATTLLAAVDLGLLFLAAARTDDVTCCPSQGLQDYLPALYALPVGMVVGLAQAAGLALGVRWRRGR